MNQQLLAQLKQLSPAEQQQLWQQLQQPSLVPGLATELCELPYNCALHLLGEQFKDRLGQDLWQQELAGTGYGSLLLGYLLKTKLTPAKQLLFLRDFIDTKVINVSNTIYNHGNIEDWRLLIHTYLTNLHNPSREQQADQSALYQFSMLTWANQLLTSSTRPQDLLNLSQLWLVGMLRYHNLDTPDNRERWLQLEPLTQDQELLQDFDRSVCTLWLDNCRQSIGPITI